MTQSSPHALGRKPHLVADVAAGITAALLAITVAHAATLPPREEGPAPQIRMRKTTVADTAPAPAFVFGEPVEGYEIISPFGLRKLPWEEHGRLHMGVDIAAPFGLPVKAVADGVVVRTGRDGAYGRFVEIRHAEGLRSFYAHLGSVADLAAGTAVALGTQIGQIGSTGSSTGSHLHFEVRDARGRPLNPGFFISRQYAQAADLPLKVAARVPRGMRLAYVSFIPHSKRELMAAREAAALEEAMAKADQGQMRMAGVSTVQASLAMPQLGAAQTVSLQPFNTQAFTVKPDRPRAVIEPARPAPAASAQAAAVEASAVAPPAPKPLEPVRRSAPAPDDDAPIATAST